MKLYKVTFASLLCTMLSVENITVLANECDPIVGDDLLEESYLETCDDNQIENCIQDEPVEEEPEIDEGILNPIIEDDVSLDETDKDIIDEEIEEKLDEIDTSDLEEENSDKKENPPLIDEKEEETVTIEEETPVYSYVAKTTRASQEIINRYVKPDFNNMEAYGFKNPYTQSWMGQCTWFTWGRFVEVYGYDPGFTGNGCDCVAQLVLKHPDLWEFSSTPVVGSIFSADSAHNHVGMIVGIENGVYIVQEGNLNGRNDTVCEVENDCWTQTYTMAELKSCYGEVQFANPKQEPDSSKLLVQTESQEQIVIMIHDINLKPMILKEIRL